MSTFPLLFCLGTDVDAVGFIYTSGSETQSRKAAARATERRRLSSPKANLTQHLAFLVCELLMDLAHSGCSKVSNAKTIYLQNRAEVDIFRLILDKHGRYASLIEIWTI